MIGSKIDGKPLIIGTGEIGASLYEIVRGVYADAESLDVEAKDINGRISVMHICFPYSDKFEQQVSQYIQKFKPTLTIIESTVLPGTTRRIYARTLPQPICHSPVRGRKADGFKWAFFAYTKFIGPPNEEYGKMAEEYYRSLDFKTRICNSPEETEFMKIIDTTYYGLLIAWFQEVHRICEKYNLNEANIIEFIASTAKEGGPQNPRIVFSPGYIGGHCVVPNALLLKKRFPSDFIEAMLRSNELRKRELHV